MIWGEAFEDDVLAEIDVEQCLKRLSPSDRLLIEMSFSLRCPDDYKGPWPSTFGDIGRFLGLKFGDRPMSEATIRYRRTEILSFLRGARGPLRGNGKESPKSLKTTSGKGSERPTSMDNAKFDKYIKQYLDVIEAIAMKLCNRDEDLFQDLRSVGMETLWRLEVEKAKDNEDAYIRRAVSNRMVQHLRRSRPKNYKSLQKMLDEGDQVVKDGITGGATIVDRASGRRNRIEDADDD